MKLPWIKRQSDLDARGPLLGDGDDGQERLDLPPAQVAPPRGDGGVYPESFDEVRERYPWTPEAWEKLDKICGSSVPDEMKIWLGTDVADFVAGNFFPEATPQARNATIKKMEDLARQCLELEKILKTDREARSLRGEVFSDGLADRIRTLGGSASARAGLKQAEKDNIRSMKGKKRGKVDKEEDGKSTRGNTLIQELFFIRLINYFQASGRPLKRTRDIDKGKPMGPFADFLRCIWRLLPADRVESKENIFVRNGFGVAKGVLDRQKPDKREV